MPVHRGSDSKGAYYQWGSQKKYYYEPGNTTARKIAKRKAREQGQAIRASGYNG